MTVRIEDIGDYLTVKIELVPRDKAMRRSKFLAMARMYEKLAEDALPDKMHPRDIGIQVRGIMTEDDLGLPHTRSDGE
jgi:hypothetical protein